MSDKWLNRQHDEVQERNRLKRLAEQAEAQRLNAARHQRLKGGR